MSLRSPIGRVRGLGSAKEGVEHWKMQRITAIANVVLVIWFVFQAVAMSGSGYAAWVAWFGSPYHATFVILLVVSAFWHAKLGVQVVIEDYVHDRGWKVGSLVAVNLVVIALAAACILSVLKVALKG